MDLRCTDLNQGYQTTVECNQTPYHYHHTHTHMHTHTYVHTGCRLLRTYGATHVRGVGLCRTYGVTGYSYVGTAAGIAPRRALKCGAMQCGALFCWALTIQYPQCTLTIQYLIVPNFNTSPHNSICYPQIPPTTRRLKG